MPAAASSEANRRVCGSYGAIASGTRALPRSVGSRVGSDGFNPYRSHAGGCFVSIYPHASAETATRASALNGPMGRGDVTSTLQAQAMPRCVRVLVRIERLEVGLEHHRSRILIVAPKRMTDLLTSALVATRFASSGVVVCGRSDAPAHQTIALPRISRSGIVTQVDEGSPPT